MSSTLVEHRLGRVPPLHSPLDRELLSRVGPWEIRRHATSDQRFAYFASRSMLHFQLWHPGHQISVLTPSRLSGAHFEVATTTHRGWIAEWDGVIAQFPDLELPKGSELTALCRWLVIRNEKPARPRGVAEALARNKES